MLYIATEVDQFSSIYWCPSFMKNKNLSLEKRIATDYFPPVLRLITGPSDLTQWKKALRKKTLKIKQEKAIGR